MAGQLGHVGPYRGELCRRPGCGQPARSRGLCRADYEAARKSGVYMPTGPAAPGEPDWMGRGLCARPGADPDVWFPADDDEDGQAAAVAACAGCPVRDACLSWALEFGERWGVWGGLTADERQAMSRARVA